MASPLFDILFFPLSKKKKKEVVVKDLSNYENINCGA